MKTITKKLGVVLLAVLITGLSPTVSLQAMSTKADDIQEVDIADVDKKAVDAAQAKIKEYTGNTYPLGTAL
ncbi:hypothetical protein WJ0W_000902 [Paenibacillus melissococcoides]|uniref:Uncharacterized protein n=1 Tax=Paenibacillus melissococcoides TaxID=2912268 RepID=A0ABM9FWV7_9BACL|nr:MULTISPECIES: hypothetical protein [Paenibacillus]MEB9892573.1 hypothetical protein [Bacillus cereus]CAH8243662.1 hypothetical protein WJ0W_000902 [Paenibacillus melissococcoides]CAH8704964.1 hypothetical protein HTL2_000748 [Paenibacillus melissococcoides]CAH8707737.1 hypothetical protein WDD9_001711 [Paenibacillus melissococcoides]GIO77465.1 hypothetical protein J6TS7_10750 [Paenibacillus dendritiformis]